MGGSETTKTACHRGLILIRGNKSGVRGEGNEHDGVRYHSAALPAYFIQSQMLGTLGQPGLEAVKSLPVCQSTTEFFSCDILAISSKVFLHNLKYFIVLLN